ncbi:hypothetical protein Q0M94_25275 (plasmid) [Deinococcus radiomollis]|uniref:hypothetical protein n=1 Tax=Deinococcus radiomollis TaxID=468916 RepID=UPI00389193FD
MTFFDDEDTLEVDPLLEVAVATARIDALARSKGARASVRHHAVLVYQAHKLLEDLGAVTASRLGVSSERSGLGRRFWYEGTDLRVTSPLFPIARTMLLGPDGELRASYVEAVRTPPNLESFTSPVEIREAQIEVMVGPYTVVTMLENSVLDPESAGMEARMLVTALVDAGLQGGPPGPTGDARTLS